MITTTLVVLLGSLLAIVLWKLFQKSPASQAAPAQPAEDLSSLSPSQAKPGDVISIAGAAKDFRDLDFTVDRRDDFAAGARSWSELSGPYQDRRVTLEVHEEDPVEMFAVFDARRLTLDELSLSEDDLGQIDERQNTSDNFVFEEKPWFYRFSKEVRASRGGVPAAPFYCWRFVEEGDSRAMTVRKAEGEPFSATIAVKVSPRDVSVFRGA